MRFRKALSIFLAVCMILSSVSVAYAEEIPVTEPESVVAEAAAEETEITEETAEAAEVTEEKTEAEMVAEENETTEAVTEEEVPEASPSEEDGTEGVKADIILEAAAADGMKVTLKADTDTFEYAEGLTLIVETVDEEVAEEASEELEKETKDDNVAKRVTYDIKVMHGEEELEPLEGKKVKVEFTMTDIPSGADAVSVYHHAEEDDETVIETIVEDAPVNEDNAETVSDSDAVVVSEDESATKSGSNTETADETDEDDIPDDADIVDDVTVSGVTDSFSLYTVDFTYDDITVSIPGGSTGNKLADIVKPFGIEEDITFAAAYQDAECTEAAENNEVKNADGDVLYRVYESEGEWYADAVNSFQTEHGLKVKTSDNAEYVIKVTDPGAGAVCKITKCDADPTLVGIEYNTVQKAVNAAGTAETTITMIDNSMENVGISGDFNNDGDTTPDDAQNITLDLNGFVLMGYDFDASVIENSGTLTITDSNTDNQKHNFKVGSDGKWDLTDTTEGAKALEDLTSIPAENDIITVTGGCITGGSYFYGGGILNYKTLTINKGNIIGNQAGKGGAIYCEYESIVTIKGGIIAGNYASSEVIGGGAIGLDGSGALMRGGKLCFNTAQYNGGAVDTNQGTFHMYDGEICYNHAKFGGGVFNGKTAQSFHMHGGKITGNIAKQYGGGVYNQEEYEVDSYEEQIRLKSCETVTKYQACSFEGECIVKGNYSYHGGEYTEENKTRDNVCTVVKDNEKCWLLIGNPYMTDIKGLSGSEIGVTVLGYGELTKGQFTANGALTDEQYFFSDSDAYAVKYNAGGYLELVDAYAISEATCENGSVSAGNKKSAYAGETVTVSATPDTGYILDTIKVYKTGEETTTVTVTDSTFTMPGYPVTISATFKKQTSDPVTPKSSGSSGGSSSYNSGWQPSGINWQYIKSDGSYARNEWLQIELNGEKKWYHFGNDTMMDTGWFLDSDGSWHYLNKEEGDNLGTMYTGWLTDPYDGYRYYLDPTTGKMLTGWHVVDGVLHYFNETVPSASGWTQDAEGNWVYDKRSVIPLGAMLQ